VKKPILQGVFMKTGTGLFVILVLTAGFLSGCLGTNTIPEPTPENPGLLVDYQRMGGIAGVDDRLVIFDNGNGLVQSRTTSREILVNRSDLERIATVFNESRFSKLDGNYTSARGGVDLLRYSIKYRGRTVVTEDTAMPSSLEPVIREMNRILDNGLGGNQGDLSLPRFAL
jgi:hypothetical protein